MDFEIIAESAVHPGRKLLVDRNGAGYLQLTRDTDPIAVSERDFARLRAMSHYRPVPEHLFVESYAIMGETDQIAF